MTYTKKYPDGCKRCHFRPITHRIESLCEECHAIANGERKHRSRIVPCDFCAKKFADYHSKMTHENDRHGQLHFGHAEVK